MPGSQRLFLALAVFEAPGAMFHPPYARIPDLQVLWQKSDYPCWSFIWSRNRVNIFTSTIFSYLIFSSFRFFRFA
jgi:hypothetical protein